MSEIEPDDIIVLELSSFQLMDMDVSPEISIVTNIYPDHLNVHKSYEEYQDAKKNIFKYQTENGLLILNKDNDITYSFSKEANGKVILFSSKEKLENGYIYDRDDETIKIWKDGIRRHILKRTDIKLRGIHNYENICAALAATAPLVSIEKQTEAIKSFNGVEHRLEFVRELDGVKYYNDSIGTSPASTIEGIKEFDENIFSLINAINDKNIKKAFEIYNDLIERGEEMLKIVISVTDHFRLLFTVKVLVNDKKSSDTITSMLGIHPYRVKLAIENSYKFSFEELKK